MRRLLLAAGMASPLVYLGAVVLGGAITPGYSHVSEHVSNLVRSGAPHKNALNPLFVVYNLLVLAFAAGLFTMVGDRPANRRRTAGTLAALSLAVEGAAGFATVFFPKARKVPR